MMKKQNFYFIIVLVAAVLLSGISSYFFLERQNYQHKTNVIFTKEQLTLAHDALDHLSPDDYDKALEKLQEEAHGLSVYLNILEDEERVVPDPYLLKTYPREERPAIKSKYAYSKEQAEAKCQILDYCVERLLYATKHGAYLVFVQEQANKLNDFSVFAEGTKSNIQKTERDFSLLYDISISPMVTVGVSMLMSNPFSNIIGIFIALLCAGLLSVNIQKQQGSIRYNSGKQYIFLFLLGIIGVFVAELVATHLTWQLGDLSVSVQSVPAFKTCRYPLSLGGFLTLRVLAKVIGCFILFLLSAGLLCTKKGAYLWLGGAALFCLVEFHFLKGTLWNFGGLFHLEDLIGVYHNSYLFQTSFATELLYGAIIMVILLACVVFAFRQINQMILFHKEQAEKEYFEEINNRYSQMRMLKHDINNHLSAMSLLLKEGRTEEAQKYLQEITIDLESTMPVARTGIHALDMILWNKISLAKENSIAIQPSIDGMLTGLQITDYELCSLLGNLLDNAIEAVQKLPEENRQISLRIGRQLDMLCIFCENPFATIQKEGNRFITLKADHQNHGLGLRQVKHIAHKYNGTVDIKTEDNLFSVSVLLTTSTSK